MLKIRNNVTEMQNASEGLIRVLDWNQPRKESRRTCQQKLLKLKIKDKEY